MAGTKIIADVQQLPIRLRLNGQLFNSRGDLGWATIVLRSDRWRLDRASAVALVSAGRSRRGKAAAGPTQPHVIMEIRASSPPEPRHRAMITWTSAGSP